MSRVRCPRCQALVQADGTSVRCARCGLAGRVAAPARPARDPWTITIDLRKAAPRNWSSGTKAFALLLVLSSAFLAGGFSGVAFERARTDIAQELDEGSGLLSSPRDDASGASPDPLLANNSSDPPAQPSPPAPPAPPAPPPEPPAEPEERVAYEGITGQGGEVKGPFELPAGVVRVLSSYHGERFFSIKLHLDQTKPELTVSASEAGAYMGIVRYGSLASAGQYYLHTNAADGEAWEVDLVVPDEEPKGASFSQSGDGDGGLGAFAFGGTHKITFETDSPHQHKVVAYDRQGRHAECSISALGDTGTSSTTCTVPEGTDIFFDVQTKRLNDGKGWTLKAERV